MGVGWRCVGNTEYWEEGKRRGWEEVEVAKKGEVEGRGIRVGHHEGGKRRDHRVPKTLKQYPSRRGEG
jgi:hypothetical protein